MHSSPLPLKYFSLSQEKTITIKKVWLKGRHHTRKGTGWKIHLPFKEVLSGISQR